MTASSRSAWWSSTRRGYHPGCGGFGGNVGHDPHLLYTLNAVYLLALCGALGRVDRATVAGYVASLQQADGSFTGDEWGEVDTRFSYCALAALSVLGYRCCGDGGAGTGGGARPSQAVPIGIGEPKPSRSGSYRSPEVYVASLWRKL